MGVEWVTVDAEQRQVIRAEINLRYFYTGRLLVSGPEPGSGMPTYKVKPPVRRLQGKERVRCVRC